MIYSTPDRTMLHSTLFDSHTLSHGFGTKVLGDGRNSKLLEMYFDKNSIRNSHIIKPQQTHSVNVRIVTKEDSEASKVTYADCDGLITVVPNVVLTVVTADCVPIIFYDPIAGIAGISHQGWRGTTNRMPAFMISTMKQLGSKPSDIRCVMGPAINICCYHLNLYEINRVVLLESGVQTRHIDIFPFCTSCDTNRFYSYRRDGGIKGEMISYITIR